MFSDPRQHNEARWAMEVMFYSNNLALMTRGDTEVRQKRAAKQQCQHSNYAVLKRLWRLWQQGLRCYIYIALDEPTGGWCLKTAARLINMNLWPVASQKWCPLGSKWKQAADGCVFQMSNSHQAGALGSSVEWASAAGVFMGSPENQQLVHFPETGGMLRWPPEHRMDSRV